MDIKICDRCLSKEDVKEYIIPTWYPYVYDIPDGVKVYAARKADLCFDCIKEIAIDDHWFSRINK